jgi:hypothetical protein
LWVHAFESSPRICWKNRTIPWTSLV